MGEGGAMGKIKLKTEMKMKVYGSQNGYCGVGGCLEQIRDIHHKVSQSVENCRKYPLFIHSPMNLVGLCRPHHEDGKVLAHYKYTYKQMDLMEEWLRNLKEGK